MDRLKVTEFAKILTHGKSVSPKPDTYKYVESDTDIVSSVNGMTD
jgi:hypothetical protein